MDLWPLPEAWEWKHLGSVAGDTERRNPGAKPDEYFRYVDIASVDNNKGEIRTGDVQSILGRNAPSRARKVIKEQDIVFATTRPYLRNIAVVPKELDGQICSTGFCVVRARSGISLPDYLFYACRSSFFIEQLLPKQRGATYPAVADNDVYDTLLPVPYPDDPARSLETQRRIVARIEALFAELRECRKLHQAVVEDTNRLMDAVLAEVFPDPAHRVPDGWFVKTVGEISSPPQYGYTQSARKEPVGPQFLRITDIQDGTVDWSSVPYCECNDTAHARYQLADGDIVFARSGATTGKTFLVKNPPDAVFASYLIRLRVVNDATPDFVWCFFQSPYYWKQIILRGGAQPNMNAQILKSIRVPIPTNPLIQSQIVSRLNAARCEIREMQTVSDTDTRLLSDMEEAILTQAFRGEL